MDYTIQLMEDQGSVIVRASGDWDAQADDAMIQQIMEVVEAGKGRKILLDLRHLHFQLPLIHFFERAVELQKQRRQHVSVSTRAAILCMTGDQKFEESVSFFETAARNRDLPYRIFKEEAQAMAWLMEAG